MRLSDIIGTCLNNLFRHKARTILTIIGVVVGCCSVVIMISFGVAMKIQMQSFLDEMGDLSVIEVTAKGSKKLTDSTVKELRGVKNISGVLPQYAPQETGSEFSFSIQTSDGRYVSSYPTFMGMDSKEMKEFGFEAESGSLPAGGEKNEVVIGSIAAYDFIDTMRPDGSNMVEYWSFNDDGSLADPPDPYFDPMNTKMQLVITSNADERNKKAYDITVSGIFKEDDGKGYVTMNGFVIDTGRLKELIDDFKHEYGMVSDARTSYAAIKAKASDISNVNDVDKDIRSLGYNTYSMESMRESIEKEANRTQLMFAGLGVVSLFVAALGIMNTMIMAISERTREIGVMKALGCFVDDIRKIFLFEAGFIGLIGGVIGSVLSLLLSQAVNIVALGIDLHETDWETLKETLFFSTERISVVPWQLAVGAVGFSVLVGVAAGFYPANRAATKISPLEAIKTE